MFVAREAEWWKRRAEALERILTQVCDGEMGFGDVEDVREFVFGALAEVDRGGATSG